MTTSFDKWPAEIKVERVYSSSLNQELDLYFVTGVMNFKQRGTIKEAGPVVSEFTLAADRVVSSTLVNRQQ